MSDTEDSLSRILGLSASQPIDLTWQESTPKLAHVESNVHGAYPPPNNELPSVLSVSPSLHHPASVPHSRPPSPLEDIFGNDSPLSSLPSSPHPSDERAAFSDTNEGPLRDDPLSLSQTGIQWFPSDDGEVSSSSGEESIDEFDPSYEEPEADSDTSSRLGEKKSRTGEKETKPKKDEDKNHRGGRGKPPRQPLNKAFPRLKLNLGANSGLTADAVTNVIIEEMATYATAEPGYRGKLTRMVEVMKNRGFTVEMRLLPDNLDAWRLCEHLERNEEFSAVEFLSQMLVRVVLAGQTAEYVLWGSWRVVGRVLTRI